MNVIPFLRGTFGLKRTSEPQPAIGPRVVDEKRKARDRKARLIIGEGFRLPFNALELSVIVPYCVVCDTFGCCDSREQHTYGPDCICGRKQMSDEQYLITERQKAAEKLKNLAEEIAAAFEEIAHGNDKAKRREAQKFLRDHVDGYWHTVLVGNRTDVSKALADEETDL